MERIIRLNAVEILCQSGIIEGMNQHSLRPRKHLAPQKLIVSGMNFASRTEAFVNAVNTKCNTLYDVGEITCNTSLQVQRSRSKESSIGFCYYLDQVQIKIALLKNDSSKFMHGKVVSTYEDAENKRKISSRPIKLNCDDGTKTN
ncbi:MAG: hypothetical protein VKN72_03400 [Nostocales cyanobacterium 94392]|nr:hypothetical protein [Nostocales cyanobacterium 94392]